MDVDEPHAASKRRDRVGNAVLWRLPLFFLLTTDNQRLDVSLHDASELAVGVWFGGRNVHRNDTTSPLRNAAAGCRLRRRDLAFSKRYAPRGKQTLVCATKRIQRECGRRTWPTVREIRRHQS